MSVKKIPYGRQSIIDSDIEAVTAVLKSDFLTQGPAVERFEKAVADYCGVRHAVAVNSATSALHIGCLALGLQKGGLLFTSPNTFVASANCALYCEADVDFVDINPQTYNLCPEKLEARLKRSEKIPDIVVPVHFSGQSCDMQRLKELSTRYGFKIMEDASHSIGAEYKGGKVGDCRFADLCVMSFHPVKIITTGEGGLVLTNSSELYQKLIRLRSHGITRNPDFMEGKSEGPWYYQQIELGLNYRLTDLQAALGQSQMQRLDLFIARRREIAALYFQKLAHLPLILPFQAKEQQSSWHLFAIQIDPQKTQKTRLEVYRALHDQGILVNVHYIPVHTQPYYKKLGFKAGDFPEAENYYAHALSLPMYYGLENSEIDRVVKALEFSLQ